MREVIKRIRALCLGNRQEIISAPDVYIANTSTAQQWGVFAARNFKKGEIVERCSILIIEEPLCELPEQLKPLAFDWETLTQTEDASAIVLGYASLYNEGNLPNMGYEVEAEQSLLVLKTIRPVEKDEELTVDYGAIRGGPSPSRSR